MPPTDSLRCPLIAGLQEDTIGSPRSARTGGTLQGVNVGLKLRVQDADGADLGIAHAPPPIDLGDVVALSDGSIWRVVNMIDLTGVRSAARVVDVICMVEPA